MDDYYNYLVFNHTTYRVRFVDYEEYLKLKNENIELSIKNSNLKGKIDGYLVGKYPEELNELIQLKKENKSLNLEIEQHKIKIKELENELNIKELSLKKMESTLEKYKELENIVKKL